MEYRSAYERIDNITNINDISKKICAEYKLGNFTSYQLIDIGYEDFNYILNTDNNKYVVKIFNTERDDIICNRLINILVKSMENDIPVPKIFKVNDQYIYKIKIKKTLLRLFVMEYIDGKNFYELNQELNYKQLKQVAKIAAKINSIDYNIKETFYDEWTVTNLKEEYNKKKQYLTSEDNQIVSKIVQEFSKINFEEMKHSYIHGDIIKANLMLNKSDKIYILDFSAFNYLPRIVEIVAVLLGLCVTDDKESTINKINKFLSYYNEYNLLYDNEIKVLPILLKALASMYIIQTSYIKFTTGDYIENDYWFNQGKKYLEMNINNNEISLNKNEED